MGFRLPIGAIAPYTVSEDSLIDEVRAIDGTLLCDTLSHKQSFSGETILLPVDRAVTLYTIIRGFAPNGHTTHHFPFDENGFSDKGRAATGLFTIDSSPTPRFGPGYLRTLGVTAITSGYGSLPTWTVAGWRFFGSVWRHLIKTSAGDFWLDGVKTSSPPFDWPFTAGTLGLSTSSFQIDDLVFLPIVIDDQTAETWPRNDAFAAKLGAVQYEDEHGLFQERTIACDGKATLLYQSAEGTTRAKVAFELREV